MKTLFAFRDMLTANNKKTDDHIFIKTMKQAEEINLRNVILMTLCADCSGDPQMLLVDENRKGTISYHFPLLKGHQIYVCNEFLRSLDTDIDIKFNTYKEYEELIEKCFDAIKQ